MSCWRHRARMRHSGDPGRATTGLDLPPGGSRTVAGPGTVPGDEEPAMDRMTIGEFARESRLSPKALRLYDEMGVLVPAHVDPSSGYRLYDPAQLESARLVASLRQLGMPLAQIRDLAGRPDVEIAALVGDYWAQA